MQFFYVPSFFQMVKYNYGDNEKISENFVSAIKASQNRRQDFYNGTESSRKGFYGHLADVVKPLLASIQDVESNVIDGGTQADLIFRQALNPGQYDFTYTLLNSQNPDIFYSNATFSNTPRADAAVKDITIIIQGSLPPSARTHKAVNSSKFLTTYRETNCPDANGKLIPELSGQRLAKENAYWPIHYVAVPPRGQSYEAW